MLCPGPLPCLLSSFVGQQWCVIWVNVILPFPAEGLLESIDPCCWACFTECDNVPGVCDFRTVSICMRGTCGPTWLLSV